MAFPGGLRPPINGPQESGIVLALYPSTERRLSVELQRSSGGGASRTIGYLDAGQNSGKNWTFRDGLPLDGGTRTYRARHSSGLWWGPGPWTPSVSAQPVELGDDFPLGPEAFRQAETVVSGDGVLLGVVSQKDGVNILPFMTGYQSGAVNGGVAATGWTDGPAVTFAKAFGNTPVVKLYPEAGVIHYQPDATQWASSAAFVSTGPQSVELKAVNVTPSGFTPRARLVQRSGGLTARTAFFSTGNNLTAAGQATTATPASAPSHNDQYDAHYKVDLSMVSLGTPQTATVVVAVDANTTGGYVQAGSKSYSAKLLTTASTASWASETQTLSVTGVVSTDKMRVRLKTVSISPGTTDDVTVAVHGFHGGADPVAGLTYQTQASAVYAAMCASTQDTVAWGAWSPGAST